jgi:hypothetical protein
MKTGPREITKAEGLAVSQGIDTLQLPGEPHTPPPQKTSPRSRKRFLK